jgi:tRNAThr (cytosine32-N3)-methyltransferase
MPESTDKKACSSVAGFGGRYLVDEDSVFDHNAWYVFSPFGQTCPDQYIHTRDAVEWTPENEQEALIKIEAQKVSRIPDDDQAVYHDQPNAFWNSFYQKNNNRFFKDRKWLKLEFPELFLQREEPARILEVGCGAGNTIFPLVEAHEEDGSPFFVYGCDYSSEAIQIVLDNPAYDEGKCKAFVYDVTNPLPPPEIPPGTIDVVVCIFVLSALHPETWKTAVSNMWKLLKPGGLVVLRDYGRYDLAQVRFKKERMLQDNFYIRGDGTRVYFFTNEELRSMFGDFQEIQNTMDRRLLVNRAKKLKMFRCWIQAKFRKPLTL